MESMQSFVERCSYNFMTEEGYPDTPLFGLEDVENLQAEELPCLEILCKRGSQYLLLTEEGRFWWCHSGDKYVPKPGDFILVELVPKMKFGKGGMYYVW